MGEQPVNLVDSFDTFFNVNLASTPNQMQDIYRLRYRIYCNEFGYEDPSRYPDSAEQDEFDDYSLQCLISHKASGIPAGCMRLVPGSYNQNYVMLPFEKYCGLGLDQAYIHSLNMSRDTVCEISRLAVDSSFRQRSGETFTCLGKLSAFDLSSYDQRNFSIVALGGYLTSIALANITGRTNIFTMMEPPLAEILNKAGITFRCVGESVEYHGHRAPYFIKSESVLSKMEKDVLKLYEIIHKKLQYEYNRATILKQESKIST